MTTTQDHTMEQDSDKNDDEAERAWKSGGPPPEEEERTPMRPGDGLDWDGSIKDEDVPHGRGTIDIIEYCERCGKAGADVHKMVGIGRNRDPVCEDCGTKTMRQCTVANLSDEVRTR